MDDDQPQPDRGGSSALRVLVADDDEDLLELIAALLRLDGFRVTEVLDGRFALDSIAQAAASMDDRDRIDLVVLDLAMPHHQGLEILRLIRRARWTVPVIVITAQGPRVAEEALESGAVAVLSKPFEIDQFRLRVAETMTAKRAELSSTSTRR